MLPRPQRVLEAREHPHNAFSGRLLRHLTHASLELPDVHLPGARFRRPCFEDEPALLVEATQRLFDYHGLADAMLADDERRAGPRLSEHSLERRDDLGASADRRQRAEPVASLTNPTDRSEEIQPGSLALQLLEGANGLVGQRALELGHDVGHSFFVRWVDGLRELRR